MNLAFPAAWPGWRNGHRRAASDCAKAATAISWPMQIKLARDVGTGRDMPERLVREAVEKQVRCTLMWACSLRA